MKFAVNLTSPTVVDSLKKGNYRGEPRWERQAVEALLEGGHEVYTLMDGSWSPPHTKPGNLHYTVNSNIAKDCVGIAHDFQPASVPPIFKAQIFNMFSIHYFRDLPDKVQEYKNKYGRNLIFTQGYYGTPNEQDIIKAAGQDYYEYLPVPGIPKIHDVDNFNKKRIVWLSRGIHLHAFPDKENPELVPFIDWVKSKLEQDNQLEFFIIPGLGQRDMDWQKWNCTVEERVFQSPIMQRLNPWRSQIKVVCDVGWDEILDIMADTKLSVSVAPDRWGGPPVEAAMYGIPYVSPAHPHCFMHVGGHISTHAIGDRIRAYDKLFTDHNHYRSTGDSLRNFCRDHYTYESFRNHLMRMLAARGIT